MKHAFKKSSKILVHGLIMFVFAAKWFMDNHYQLQLSGYLYDRYKLYSRKPWYHPLKSTKLLSMFHKRKRAQHANQ